MLNRLRAADLLWSTLWMVPALAVLLGLGTWQLQRMAWKNSLVQRMGERLKAEPVGLDEALRRMRETGDVEYLRVRVGGRFLHDLERYFYYPDPRLGQGYHVYTPLVVRSGAGCRDIVIVNRGFVTEAVKSPQARAAGQVGEVTVAAEGPGQPLVGLVRLGEQPGSFTPANDVKRNLWFWRDIAGLWTSFALPASEKSCETGGRPYPFTIDAEAEPANPGGWPRGGATNVVIANRHLEYALTWYGLALTLIGVYAAFAWPRLRGVRGGSVAG